MVALANMYKGKFNGPLTGTYGSAHSVPLTYLEETKDTAKLLDNMVAAGLRADEGIKQLVRIMLASIGGEIAKTARASIQGMIGIPGEAIVAARPATMDLRHANRKGNPLLEYGVLSRNIVAKIVGDGTELNVFVKETGRKIPADRPGQMALKGGMNALAMNLERGYSMNITQASRSYFKQQISTYRNKIKGYKSAGAYDGNVDFVLARSAMSGFTRLLALPMGRYQVPARPFMRPAAEFAIKKFFEKDFGGWGRMMENFIVHNKITFPGGGDLFSAE